MSNMILVGLVFGSVSFAVAATSTCAEASRDEAPASGGMGLFQTKKHQAVAVNKEVDTDGDRENQFRRGACDGCSECIAVPGNGQGTSDTHCAPCANGGQAWWPCATDGLCQCAVFPTPRPTLATPKPTPVPTPAPTVCVLPTRGRRQSFSDGHCSVCKTGYKGWPCNETRLCDCSLGGERPSPLPTAPTPTATPVAWPTQRPTTSRVTPVPTQPVTPVPTQPVKEKACGSTGDGNTCKGMCKSGCVDDHKDTQTNQCWGGPERHIECICNDGTKLFFPGCECTRSTCPDTNPTPRPTMPPVPTPVSTPTKAPGGPTPAPPAHDDLIQKVKEKLEASDSEGVFMYETPTLSWEPSDLYTWSDMTLATVVMARDGVGEAKLWLGNTVAEWKYGLVNIAMFLAQCMQETIRYNVCDENNWSDKTNVVDKVGGSVYSSASACGQMTQSYQNYQCTKEENDVADGQMECDIDPDMEIRAETHAAWYGAPPPLFCAPKWKVPKTPRWDYAGPWCPPPSGWGYEPPIPKWNLPAYWDYVNNGGSCKDYDPVKAGGWKFTGAGCVGGACPGAAAPLFGQDEGRTDLEGCCWWGRGVIQTTGVCNFGKLNFYMGKRAFDRGAKALYPNIDFCRDPGAVCKTSSPPELKWVAGFFYWLNSVQPYEKDGWNFKAKLIAWVDAGMSISDYSVIDGASGIVNRGCHNPPNCNTGELHHKERRRANFVVVMKAMGLA